MTPQRLRMGRGLFSQAPGGGNGKSFDVIRFKENADETLWRLSPEGSVSAHLKPRKSGLSSTASRLNPSEVSGHRRALQALGGRRDHTDAREQLPPSAPSKSLDCCRLSGLRRVEVRAWR